MREYLLLWTSLFFFNDTATTEIYTLSLHDALPISPTRRPTTSVGSLCTRGRLGDLAVVALDVHPQARERLADEARDLHRSEEHTSELQSRQYLVCRLLLEKKKINVPHTSR